MAPRDWCGCFQTQERLPADGAATVRKLPAFPSFLNLLFTLSSEAVNLAFTCSPDAYSGLPLVCSGGERRCVQCHRFIAVTRVIGRPRRAPGPASLLRSL